jgi:hypothetical protein
MKTKTFLKVFFLTGILLHNHLFDRSEYILVRSIKKPSNSESKKIQGNEQMRLYDSAFLGKKRIYFNKSAFDLICFIGHVENTLSVYPLHRKSEKHADSTIAINSTRSPPTTT